MFNTLKTLKLQLRVVALRVGAEHKFVFLIVAKIFFVLCQFYLVIILLVLKNCCSFEFCPKHKIWASMANF